MAGVANTGAVIRAAVARALEMMDNTIGELVRARARICAGETPGWPLLSDLTGDWLINRLSVCAENVSAWTAGTFVNRSVAEVIRRLTQVRNIIASNWMRYTCNDPRCAAGDWAFVMIDPTCRRTPASVIHLCSGFWNPAPGVSAADHAEFQAQTIIHEASHLYHCTSDARGATIGVAECMAQFVAATNNSPLDPTFSTRCTRSTACQRRPVAGVNGLGAPDSSSGLVAVRVRFNPRLAVRPTAGRAARTRIA